MGVTDQTLGNPMITGSDLTGYTGVNNLSNEPVGSFNLPTTGYKAATDPTNRPWDTSYPDFVNEILTVTQKKMTQIANQWVRHVPFGNGNEAIYPVELPQKWYPMAGGGMQETALSTQRYKRRKANPWMWQTGIAADIYDRLVGSTIDPFASFMRQSTYALARLQDQVCMNAMVGTARETLQAIDNDAALRYMQANINDHLLYSSPYYTDDVSDSTKTKGGVFGPKTFEQINYVQGLRDSDHQLVMGGTPDVLRTLRTNTEFQYTERIFALDRGSINEINRGFVFHGIAVIPLSFSSLPDITPYIGLTEALSDTDTKINFTATVPVRGFSSNDEALSAIYYSTTKPVTTANLRAGLHTHDEFEAVTLGANTCKMGTISMSMKTPAGTAGSGTDAQKIAHLKDQTAVKYYDTLRRLGIAMAKKFVWVWNPDAIYYFQRPALNRMDDGTLPKESFAQIRQLRASIGAQRMIDAGVILVALDETGAALVDTVT